MAAAASTTGVSCLRHQHLEHDGRGLTPYQECWQNPRQSRASKRAAVDANAMGGDSPASRRSVPASRTPVTLPAGGCVEDGPTRLFSALRILMAGCGGERWLETTLELQCVCFQACKDCRELVPLRLLVSKRTPEHLWKQGATAWKAIGRSSSTLSHSGSGSSSGGYDSGAVCGESESDVRSEFSDDHYDDSDCGSIYGSDKCSNYGSGSDSNIGIEYRSGSEQPLRWAWQRPLQMDRAGLGYPMSLHRDLPAPRIASMVWERPTMADVSFGSDLAEITFGPTVIEPLHGVAWTRGLKRLTLSSNWNLPVAAAVAAVHDGGAGDDVDVDENWPPSLQELFFGRDFSRTVDDVAFPASLLHLSFGENFNHSVDLVAWPPALQRLTFGRSFNQSIERVSWPSSLQQLSFGVSFDQPLGRVVWPASLHHLSFGYRFDQPVDGVVWPVSLQTLSFGHDFNQHLAGVVWPASLKQLSFGFEFDQPVAGVSLPASLQQITFGYCFNQPITGVAWPACLQQLTLGGLFNHPIDGVVWPASLRCLTLGYGFMQIVEKGMWPIGLSHLSVDRCYPLSSEVSLISSSLSLGRFSPAPPLYRAGDNSTYGSVEAAAPPTPGVVCLLQQDLEQEERDLIPCQEPWHKMRQPMASKRAAVHANAVGAASRRPVPTSKTPVTLPAGGCVEDGSARLFSALRILMAGCGGERWLEYTLELQCVCFKACKDCRELVPLRLLVSKRTPEHLWKQGATAWKAIGRSSPTLSHSGSGSSSGGYDSGAVCGESESDIRSEFNDDHYDSDCGREYSGGSGPLQMDRAGMGYSMSLHRDLPAPRIASMVWERPTMADVSFGSDLAEITFGPTVIEPLHGVAWTRGLKRLTLSSNWNLPVAAAVAAVHDGGAGDDVDVDENWPPSLQELFFGRDFSRTVDDVAFPASLLHLSFGENFNHSVDLVAWPPALQRLTFGRSFNQSIERVSWPASLQQLSFGVSFDQPLGRVVWPASLHHLSFGYRFDQPVDGVVWPVSLQTLSFGHDFNQHLAGVVWPASLKQLSFGFEFDQPVAGVSLPASLQQITFGYCFNQPITGVAWPACLQQLTLGGLFNHPIDGVVWPASLRCLTLGYGFMQIVEKGMWPIGLSHLSVDRCYPLSRSSLPIGMRVELT
eukprot:g7094.t1